MVKICIKNTRASFKNYKKKMKVRSKHNDLMNYFIHDKRDLSPAYVRKCERFLWSLRNAGLITKPQANTLFRLQAPERVGPPKKESGSKQQG